MASIADKAYRLVCKSFGASVVFSEMVSVKGLCYRDKNSAELCRAAEGERPFGLQLFGSEPIFFEQATRLIRTYEPDFIDINMGCPVPKVTGIGAGSKLLLSPRLAGEIVNAVKSAANCPVTAKIRAGWDSEHITALEVALSLEAGGADAVTVHGRTKTQMYSGRGDRGVIRAVKSALSIPVFGNGDIDGAMECMEMYRETGCDLALLARGSYGRPWIFREINTYINEGIIPQAPSNEERMETLLWQVSLMIEDKGEARALREARKQAGFYFKGLPGAAHFRHEASSIESYEDLKNLTKGVLEHCRRNASGPGEGESI